jgi:hypothetical protein
MDLSKCLTQDRVEKLSLHIKYMRDQKLKDLVGVVIQADICQLVSVMVTQIENTVFGICVNGENLSDAVS